MTGEQDNGEQDNEAQDNEAQDNEAQDNEAQQTTQGQDRDADEHDYVDRSKIDFDPDDGHYTGTAVDGTSDIPGPHEQDGSAEEQSGSDQPEQQ